MIRIGHRGAAGHVTENTLASLQKALQIGVDMIEIDVQATRDGELVIFHDRSLNRMTDLSGFVSEARYRDIADTRLRPDYRYRIPTLAQVIEQVRDSGVTLYVEVKAPGHEKQILDLLAAGLPEDRYLIGSFAHSVLQASRQIRPRCRTIALMSCIPLDLGRFLKRTGCDIAGFEWGFVDAGTVDVCRNSGVQCFVYTADQPHEIEYLKSIGVDGIVSNFPDRL